MRRDARLKGVIVPKQIGGTAIGGTATSTSLVATIGSIAGLLALFAVPLLFLALLRRRRELSEVRSQLHATMALESHLRSRRVRELGE